MLTTFLPYILRKFYLLYACNQDQVASVCKLLTGCCPLTFVFCISLLDEDG